MFRLSRRKGSSLWQVRKRWPSDVAAILPGEFTKSTGEADRKKAQAMLPLIASEYESRVQQARDRLADSRFRDLAEPEIARLTALFYRTALPAYRINRALSPAEAKATLAEVQGRVASLEAAQARQDYWAVESAAKTLIAQQGLPIPEDSPSRDTLKSMLHLAFTELHRGIAQQLQGEEQAAPSDPRLARALEIKADAPDHTVNALIKAYKEAKWEDWSASSREAVEAPFRALKDILGDRDASSVTREDARRVVAMLRDLPAGMGRHAALKGLSVPQAIEAGKRLKIEPIKPATINRAYLAHIAALFKWALKEGWITSTPFTGLAVKDSVAEIDKRDPFTAPQLQTLFTSDPWVAPAKPDMARPGRFWIPLVALFTGARLGEIAGLRIADVEEVDGLTALRIRAHAGRSLKTSYSRRDLPLHAELVRLLIATQKLLHRRGRPHMLPVKAAKECLEVRYRRSRWSKVDYEGSDDVRARITDGIIMVEGERAGRIQFTEFRLGTFVTRREFWRTMDDASAEMSALAEVINESWEEPTDVAAYGDIVELKRVWIRPSLTGRGRLDAVSDTMLTELFESRALLILKAFPLEYEGAVTPDNEAMFKRRQAAMMRRYSAMLGVQPLPGKNGQEGWMYGVPARLAGIIQRPATWGPPRADEDW